MKNSICLFLLTAIHHLVKKFYVFFISSFIVLLLLPEFSHCQTFPDTESLENKASLFINRVEYDSAEIYYFNLVEYFHGAGNIKQEIINLINLADARILLKNIQGAKLCLIDATEALEKNFKDDFLLRADLYQVKGSYHALAGQNDSAKQYLFRSIDIRSSTSGQQDTLLHYAYNKLGNLYRTDPNIDSAFYFYKMALDVSLLKKDRINFLSASSYQNVAIAAHILGDFNLAEIYYTKSLELKEQLFPPNDPALNRIYNNLGKFFTDLAKFDLALFYYDKSEQSLSSKYIKDQLPFAHLYWNKGNVYTLKGDYIKAFSYLSKAYSIFKNNLQPEDQNLAKVLADIGFVFEKQGETRQAIEYYHESSKNKKMKVLLRYTEIWPIFTCPLMKPTARIFIIIYLLITPINSFPKIVMNWLCVTNTMVNI